MELCENWYNCFHFHSMQKRQQDNVMWAVSKAFHNTEYSGSCSASFSKVWEEGFGKEQEFFLCRAMEHSWDQLSPGTVWGNLIQRRPWGSPHQLQELSVKYTLGSRDSGISPPPDCRLLSSLKNFPNSLAVFWPNQAQTNTFLHRNELHWVPLPGSLNLLQPFGLL